MVIDTAALLAILQDDPERRRFNEAIDAADSRRMSAATLVEVSIVVESRFGADRKIAQKTWSVPYLLLGRSHAE